MVQMMGPRVIRVARRSATTHTSLKAGAIGNLTASKSAHRPSKCIQRGAGVFHVADAHPSSAMVVRLRAIQIRPFQIRPQAAVAAGQHQREAAPFLFLDVRNQLHPLHEQVSHHLAALSQRRVRAGCRLRNDVVMLGLGPIRQASDFDNRLRGSGSNDGRMTRLVNSIEPPDKVRPPPPGAPLVFNLIDTTSNCAPETAGVCCATTGTPAKATTATRARRRIILASCAAILRRFNLDAGDGGLAVHRGPRRQVVVIDFAAL